MAWIRGQRPNQWAWWGLGLVLSCLPDVEIPAPAATNACGDGIVQLSLGEACDPGSAASPGCTADCRLTCTGLLDPVTGHCYFTAASGNFQQARQSCTALGGHIVRFASKSEVVLVSSAMDGGAPAWVDLQGEDGGFLASPYFQTADNSEPGWRGGIVPTKQCSGCYASTDLAAQFPVPEGGVDGPNVVFSKDIQYTWFAAPSGITISAVCEREPPGAAAAPCEAGTCIELAPTWTSTLYVLQTKPATYADSTAACTAMNGKLAILNTPEEREELTRALAQANVASAWIGLTASQPDTWVWADGTTVASKAYIVPWAENEPAPVGAAYVKMDPSAYDTRLAHADAVTSSHPFVCEITLR